MILRPATPLLAAVAANLAIAVHLAAYAPAVAATNSDKAYNLATRLAATIKKCWIDSGDATDCRQNLEVVQGHGVDLVHTGDVT